MWFIGILSDIPKETVTWTKIVKWKEQYIIIIIISFYK